MGRKKEIKYINGRLAGKMLDEETCAKLEKIIKASKDKGSVSKLKNLIVNMRDKDLETCLVTKNTNHIEEYLPAQLEDAQTLGVSFMYLAKRCLLGDSVGVGKTVETAGVCNLIKQKNGEFIRFLYLTEKTLASEARRKLTRFTGRYVELLYGNKKDIIKYAQENEKSIYHDLVGTHSLLNSGEFQTFLINFEKENGYFPFEIVIVDESSILKNSSNLIWKNCKKVMDSCEYAFMLNATPFETFLGDFYNQLSCLDSTFLPTKTSFSDAFEEKEFNGVFSAPNGKYRNPEIFRHQVGYRYFAQTRAMMGAVMENCSAHLIKVPLSLTQRKLLSQVSMPQMVYDYPKYFTFNNINEDSPKIEALIQLIDDVLYMEPSILIYTVYKDVQKDIKEILEARGISAEYMNGDTPTEIRNNLIKGFTDQSYRVLITNVQKGLDFGHCNAAIFYSYDPSPSKMVQFEGRMTRSFNIRDKRVFLIATEGREIKRLKDIIVERAKASSSFAESDFSCVLGLLCDSEEWD